MFRLGSALLLCAIVTGCGFRSGFETQDFELVSFGLDQSSYVQGQSGVAKVVIRNLGPTASAPPTVTLRADGVGEGLSVELTTFPDEIAPGETAIAEWDFALSDTVQPGEGRAWANLVDESGQVDSPPVEFELFLAASLQVTSLAYAYPPLGFAFEPPGYACSGGRDAYVVATVQNVGASAANVTNAGLLVSTPTGSAQDFFLTHGSDENPASVAPGATASFLFQLEANPEAPPRADYFLAFGATVTDALTGHPRPAPSQPEAVELTLTVHAPGLSVLVQEAVDTLSVTSSPATVTVQISNTGSLPLEIDAVPLRMFIGVETTDDYVIGAPSTAVPFSLAPDDVALVDIVIALDTAMSPVLGTTEVQGLAYASEQLLCGATYLASSEENGDVGSWIVE